MARFCPLFSSSSGNCIYIGSGDTHVLIDAGVSARRITDALKGINIIPEAISAIFVTHQHTDHIAGLHKFAVKRGIPIYMSEATANALEKSDFPLSELNVKVMDSKVEVGELTVNRFCTSHDCSGSSGYRIDMGDRSFAVCTDTGVVTDEIRENLYGCELVFIESNHDVNMLSRGPYPAALKRRILSDEGHLSNGSCAKELPELVRRGTQRIILGHLSPHNNTEQLALSAANAELLSGGYTSGEDYIIYVAPKQNGKLFSL